MRASACKLGNYGKERVEGMVNVPIGDTVALRVNGVWNRSDGWVKDAQTGKDLWPEDEWSTRAALRWDVSDDTQVNLAWNHDELDQKARPAYGLIPLGPDDVRAPYPPDPSTFLDPLELHDKVLNDVVGNEESRSLDDISLFIDHAFGGVDFRSTTNWRTFDTVNREDEDGTNKIALYFDTANIEDNTSWYQEFKFSGKNGAFDWVGGVSYYCGRRQAGERYPRVHRQHRHGAVQPRVRRGHSSSVAGRHAVRLHQRFSGGQRHTGVAARDALARSHEQRRQVSGRRPVR